MKKLLLILFSLYYFLLMLAATPFNAEEVGIFSDVHHEHLLDNNTHTPSNSSLSAFFEEKENDFDILLNNRNYPVIQKLIFLFKSENPKHSCFAYYLDKTITPYHQDIYILDEVFRI